MVICSICSHSEWCDGGDRCDCQCHDVDLDDDEFYEEDYDDDEDDSLDGNEGD
jgi:hypothetical protein